ncbi:MAG: hypothetical protein A2749_00105 [Parcubacteria group bacterium RIFCSPHIGHO2_01_FULL_45_26]|nr:MAG: hypothetical protein A2749_00105 [Parcubacteria group bacterium RIFCSPHIGHO2_01_FULL_45_26]
MRINSTIQFASGPMRALVYKDIDGVVGLEGRNVQGVHAYCFCEGKLVLVHNGRHGWQPPGGHTEEGETIEQTVIREVQEETNMRVISQRLMGFQDIHNPEGVITQTRSVCLVEPISEFKSDPAGDITEIKLIEPKEYKMYFDWGEVGDHLMKKALGLKEAL